MLTSLGHPCQGMMSTIILLFVYRKLFVIASLGYQPLRKERLVPKTKNCQSLYDILVVLLFFLPVASILVTFRHSQRSGLNSSLEIYY